MKEFKITEKERNTMLCELRPWRMEDATELQKILNNKRSWIIYGMGFLIHTLWRTQKRLFSL